MKLNLATFRSLNAERAVEGFKTYQNVPLTYWTTALAGEVGELCNMIKKQERVRNGGIDGGSSYTAASLTTEDLKEEIGGIAIYLDLLASLLGVSLEDAIIDTFNSKSEKYGFKQFITATQPPSAPAVEEDKIRAAWKSRIGVSHDEPGSEEQYCFYQQGYADGVASTIQGAVEGETVFVPCDEHDSRQCGGYTSNDGRSLCHVREAKVPVVREGAVWVKASERLPEPFKVVPCKYTPDSPDPRKDTELHWGYVFKEGNWDCGWKNYQVEWLDETTPQRQQAGPKWVKATKDLPLHLAFWNIEDGFKKDCHFPIRIDGKIYGMGAIYDDRLEGAPDPKYYFVINGQDYFESEFHRIEWLDDHESTPSKDALSVLKQINLSDIDAPAFTHSQQFREHFDYIKKKFVEILSKGESPSKEGDAVE